MDDSVLSLEFYDKLKVYRAQTPSYDGAMQMAGEEMGGGVFESLGCSQDNVDCQQFCKKMGPYVLSGGAGATFGSDLGC